MRYWIVILAMHLVPFGRVCGETTFNKDVAPIVFRSCVPCHRGGESTLFSLARYDDVKKRVSQIVAVTKSRYMPPWLPAPGPLRFADEQRLTPEEIATLERWAKEGAIEGKRADLPEPPALAAEWQLGAPDIVLTAPQAYTVPAEGADLYRNFVLPVPFAGTRYVRAIQIRPGSPGLVHHANLLIDRDRSLRWRNAIDGQPGFPGMDIEIPASLTDPESHFLFWKPGARVSPEPNGLAWTLEGGSDLILNVHLKPTGKQERIQPAVGLYFTSDAPRFLPILVQLENDRALDIPPGARNFAVSDEWTLPIDADLLGVYPHAHYLGRDFRATAILPDGSRQSLIHIPRWDVNWQGVYRYAKPVPLPRGTRVLMEWSYDNSIENPALASRPPRRVTAGNQTTDEMAHLWLQILPRGRGDQRMVIQEAIARKRLLRDPDDFGAHFNLGGILQARNQPADAILELREAVRIRPRDELALTALGALIQLQNRPREARSLYERALESRPDYSDAHYDLADLLLASGEPDEAILHLKEVVRLDAADAKARAKLAEALETRAVSLAGSGRLKEAAADFRDVVALKPSDSDAYVNLGVALARQGDFSAAKECLDRALELKPDNAAARKNLDRVQQHLK